jgi:hypothetical protein
LPAIHRYQQHVLSLFHDIVKLTNICIAYRLADYAKAEFFLISILAAISIKLQGLFEALAYGLTPSVISKWRSFLNFGPRNARRNLFSNDGVEISDPDKDNRFFSLLPS